MSSRSLYRLAAGALFAGVAMLATPPAGHAAAGDAMVRVADFSPDAPAVDVYVNGNKTLSNVAFEKVSDYLSVPAGTYQFAVRPAGAAAASAPVIQASAPLAAGQAYTVAAVGKLADIKAQVYTDDLSAPPAGQARVRVIHAAPEVPAVDVGVKGQTPAQSLVKNLAFPNASDYLAVPAGSYDLEVRPTGTTTVAVPVNGVKLEAGKVYTAAAIGLGTGVKVVAMVDAAGMSGATPSGGVQTGFGGAAGSPSSGVPTAFVAAGGLAVALLFFATRRRLATVHAQTR